MSANDKNKTSPENTEMKNSSDKAVDKKSDKSQKDKNPSFFARIGKWFRELKAEMRKVVWPTRKQVLKNTVIVVSTVLIVGIFIWVMDVVLNFGVQSLIKLL